MGPSSHSEKWPKVNRGLIRVLSIIPPWISDGVVGAQFKCILPKVSYQLLFRVVGGGSAVNIIPINDTTRQYSTYGLLP